MAGRTVDRTTLFVVELLLGVEGLAARAVPAFVLRGVEVPGRLNARDDRFHALAVPRLGGADEIVVPDLELLPELVVAPHDAVGQRDRRRSLGRGRFLDVLAVLVGAGQVARVLPSQAVEARGDVADDGRVDVPDVRQVVDVVDRVVA